MKFLTLTSVTDISLVSSENLPEIIVEKIGLKNRAKSLVRTSSMCLKVRRCIIITISIRFDINAQCDPQNHRGDNAVTLKKLVSVAPRLLPSSHLGDSFLPSPSWFFPHNNAKS